MEILREASDKFARVAELQQGDHEVLRYWATALCGLAARSTGSEHNAALDAAEEKLLRYRDLTGKTSYDLACVHSLRGDAVKAVASLEACQADGLLPDPAHLDADTDLDSIRNDPAYKAFRASLEPTRPES
jgi:hypothetical protein